MGDFGGKSRFEIVSSCINAEMRQPYSYGKSDCFFLALANIDALTKTRLCKKYSNIYSSFAGAQRAMKKRGLKSIGDIFAKHLEPVAPASARLGDVVVLESGGVEHAGICTGVGFLSRDEAGQQNHVFGDVKTAYRVI